MMKHSCVWKIPIHIARNWYQQFRISFWLFFIRCQQSHAEIVLAYLAKHWDKSTDMQAWNLKLDGCIAKTYESRIWKWNPKRALPWSVLGSDNIKPWLSLTGMEKRVNYAISGQNLDIVTKTSDKNLLILTHVLQQNYFGSLRQ